MRRGGRGSPFRASARCRRVEPETLQGSISKAKGGVECVIGARWVFFASFFVQQTKKEGSENLFIKKGPPGPFFVPMMQKQNA